MSDRARGLWHALEGSYSVEGDATGAAYSPLPAMSVGEDRDEQDVLDTNYATNRPYPTAPIPGPDKGSFPVEVPLWGLATAAGAMASPPASDVLDDILAGIFGTENTVDGEDVVSHVGAALELGSDVADVQDVLPIFEAGLPTSGVRAHWAPVIADAGAGVYTIVDPGFNFTNAAVAYGTRNFRYNANGGGPTSQWVHIHDGDEYTLFGSQWTQASIVAEVGQIAKLVGQVAYDRKVATSKLGSALPAALAGPPITPVIGTLSPVFINGVAVPTRRIEIDFGLDAQPDEASGGANGRQGHTIESIEPMITIEPHFTDAQLQLKKNQTVRSVLVQLGGGVVSGGVLGGLCVYAEQATVVEANPTSTGNRKRQNIVLKVSDAVAVGANPARFFQIFRA